MNKKLTTLVLRITIGLALTGCAVSNAKFFDAIKKADDPSFGYTPENPVMIKNADLNNSIGSSYYYLAGLRTENGNKLELIQRFSVDNPNYKKPAIPLENRFTGQPLNYGTGPLLDFVYFKTDK